MLREALSASRSGQRSINARRPLSEQLHKLVDKLVDLGWGTTPPTAGEIVRRMVAYATDEYEWDRRQPENRGKVYHRKQAAGFFHGPDQNSIIPLPRQAMPRSTVTAFFQRTPARPTDRATTTATAMRELLRELSNLQGGRRGPCGV